eukprot:CAMPEP_0203908578 /NCGR_PEP_ID=MMETSP0359-20131031/49952_1 /ASSEMBLY_ACC=CAM_ASM_000338 /TAXON_ID=268821 /ORGANISM="Scrippsiella Hangoei, Strain SHTV-5" /LENGTH=49 /DNA_ID=CAMNT_0050833619 /DNA_START=165 /DNA_END=314 /DNA_ORIENTATION=+
MPVTFDIAPKLTTGMRRVVESRDDPNDNGLNFRLSPRRPKREVSFKYKR